MARRFLAFVLLLVSVAAQAQEAPGLLIKLAPLHLINGYFDQSVRVAVEARLRGRWSVQGEGGFYPSFFNQGHTQGNYGALQVRNYLWDEGGSIHRQALGIGAAYKDQRLVAENLIESGDTLSYTKAYSMTKRVWIIGAHYIISGPIDKEERWWAECSLGIVWRYKEARCAGLTDFEIENRSYGESQVLHLTLEDKVGGQFEPQILLKIGYQLW